MYVSYKLLWNWIVVLRLVSQEVWFDLGFVTWHFLNYSMVQIVSLWSFSIGVRIISTTNELVDRIRNMKLNASHNDWPPPHNQIYSRFWYAFSLFLRKFHSVNPFNGNFCKPGRAGSLRKRWTYHLKLSAKRILCYCRPNLDCFRTRSGAVHDERTCSWHGLCSKTWDPPLMEVGILWVST